MKLTHSITAVSAGLMVAIGGSGMASAASTVGDIAFTKSMHGMESVWLLDATSKRQVPITPLGAHSPAWSPGRAHLAFVSAEGQIFVKKHLSWMDTRQVTHPPEGYLDSSPVWSPDGSRLAFVRHKGAQNSIYIVHANGQHETNITDWQPAGGYRSPSWSPDGNRLVYEHFSAGKPTELLIKDIVHNSTHVVTTVSDPIPINPRWSPSGKKILFNNSTDEIYTIWPDGSHRAVISDGDSHNAVWSPSGAHIAFTEDDNSVSISGPDGSITFIDFAGQMYLHVQDLAWSQGEDKIIFTAEVTQNGREVSGIFSINLSDVRDGSVAPTTLAEGKARQLDWR